MKRKGNLYKDICNIENIEYVCDKIFKKCKNKEKVYKWESIRDVLVVKIYNKLVGSLLPANHLG